MSAFIASIVSFMKGVQALNELGHLFAEEWSKYDIARINAQAEKIKENLDQVAASVKKDTTKDERRTSLRKLTRID